MEKYISIEQTLEQHTEKLVIKKKRSLKLGIIVLCIGISLFVGIAIVNWSPSSNIPHFLLMLSIVIVIYGGIKIMFRQSFYVSVANHQRLNEYNLFFTLAESTQIEKIYATRGFSELANLNRASEGGLKIKVLTTSDFELCFSQVIGYIPYKYVPLTSVVKHDSEEANVLKLMLE